MKADALRQVPLFASLPAGEIKRLARTLRACEFAAGTVFLNEGHADEHFYVLLEGTVEILKALGSPDERSLGTREPACLLGEMSLFSQDGRHTASVRAQSAVKLLQITRSDLDDLLNRQPTLAHELVRLLSTRLEQSENTTILDLREKNRQLTIAYEELQAAHLQIVEKERLEKELAIATDIQLSVLPQTLPQPPGWDIGALIRPARAVGGDFYDLIPLGDGRLGIVVGDVCDKGVPAALFMMRTYSLLRAMAGRRSQPERVLRSVNRHLLRRNPSGMFVTLLYGILDPRSGVVDYARAGHPCPLIFTESGEAISLPSATGQPLGMWEKPKLDVQEVAVQPGGVMLLFSDGLTDPFEGETGNGILQDVCRTAATTKGATARAICERLWHDVISVSAGRQYDDCVIIALKRKER